VDRWLVFYEDRPAITRTVESKTALDAAKDFALLTPRGDDCTAVVALAEAADRSEFFERRSGVFAARELPPEPPALPPEPVPAMAAPASVPPTTASEAPRPAGYLLADNWPTGGYRGWLVSDSFIKRVAAVTGYAFVGHVLVALAVWMLVFGALAGCGSLLYFFGQR
jgi:hypothetical protein